MFLHIIEGSITLQDCVCVYVISSIEMFTFYSIYIRQSDV